MSFLKLLSHFGDFDCDSTANWTFFSFQQRWSPQGRPWPRGHILKSLALASRPQVLKNWPVLSSRTALIFELLKFCRVLEKFVGKRIFVEIAWKIFVKTFFFGDRPKNFCEELFFFFWRALALVSLVLGLGLEHSCSWPRECLSSERLSLASDFFVSLAWASSLVSSTPFLVFRVSAQSPRIRRKSQGICSGVANEQKIFNLFNIFSIRKAVSLESYCTLRGCAVHSPSNWQRLRLDCAANPQSMQYDSDECTETALRIISHITEMTKLIVLW